MRVQFPYALNIGTDIVAHSRFLFQPLVRHIPAGSTTTTTTAAGKATRSQNPTKLITKFLHPKEITELTRRFPNWWQSLNQETHPDGIKLGDLQRKLSTYLAGRWAAKEAAKKAWGAHLVGFRDLRVEVQVGGGVEIICRSFDGHDQVHVEEEEGDVDSVARDEMTGDGVEQVGKLSISHDGEYAVASVIAAPLHPDIVAALERRKVVIPRMGDS